MDGIRMPRTALRIQCRAMCVVCAYTNTRLGVLGECVHSGEKVPEKGGFTEVKIWGGKKPEI